VIFIIVEITRVCASDRLPSARDPPSLTTSCFANHWGPAARGSGRPTRAPLAELDRRPISIDRLTFRLARTMRRTRA